MYIKISSQCGSKLLQKCGVLWSLLSIPKKFELFTIPIHTSYSQKIQSILNLYLFLIAASFPECFLTFYYQHFSTDLEVCLVFLFKQVVPNPYPPLHNSTTHVVSKVAYRKLTNGSSSIYNEYNRKDFKPDVIPYLIDTTCQDKKKLSTRDAQI